MWQRVSLVKVVGRVTQSWIAFLLGLGLLAGFWYGCYWLVLRYAGSRIEYFKIGAIAAISIGGILLIFNELIVKWTTGAKFIGCRYDCPRLWDAVRAATPWHVRPYPRIYLLPSRDLNAVSFGWGIWGMSAVGATQGAVDELPSDELESVMAHEIGHIINKDILVSTAMMISLLIVGFTGWLLLRFGLGDGRSSRKSGKTGSAVLVIALVGLFMYLVGRVIGVVLQNFVSRQREYAADAASARIMGTSQPLIRALQRMSGRASLTYGAAETAVGFLCTADPDESDFMSTHPSLDKRVAALESLE